MKKQIYIVEIDMPDGDLVSSGWLQDLIQQDLDSEEDKNRQVVFVREISLPSDLDEAAEEWCKTNNKGIALSADKKSHYLAEGKDAFKAGAQWRDAQIPKLPDSIDEAAEEYAYNNWEDNDYHTGASEGLPFDAIGHTERCFKAGAEWMAGLGITFEGKASRRYENGLAGFVSWILFDQQKAAHILVNQGEEADVIINIHKK